MDYYGTEAIYVTTEKQEDFGKLVRRVNELGKTFYEDDHGCFIPFIVTLKKKYKGFEAGTKFLMAGGATDTGIQYDVRNFLNKYHPAKKSRNGSSGGWDEGEDIEFDFTPDMVDFQYFAKSFLPQKFYNDKKRCDEMENRNVKLEAFDFE